MTGAEIQAAWFSPFHFFTYLFVILVLMIAFYQWQWSKKVDKFVKVIIVKADGSSDTEYAPKEGNNIAITNPKTGLTRLWPITDMATIEMLYPGDGFIPVFLQKKIRTTIVDEGDWEPILNRGSYSTGVASPDVKEIVVRAAESLPDGEIGEDGKPDRVAAYKVAAIALAQNLKTAPTREMIGSPAILGNIAKEKVSELAITVARDIMNPLQDAIKKLGKQISPTITYIGLGLIIILLAYLIILLRSSANVDLRGLLQDIISIKRALGIK